MDLQTAGEPHLARPGCMRRHLVGLGEFDRDWTAAAEDPLERRVGRGARVRGESHRALYEAACQIAVRYESTANLQRYRRRWRKTGGWWWQKDNRIVQTRPWLLNRPAPRGEH